MNKNKELNELMPIIKEKFSKIIPEEILVLKDVYPINHSLGHMYTVGPKHIEHASKYHGGMLGDATVQAVPCAYPNCTESADAHTYNVGIFMQLAGNIRAKILQEYIDKFIEQIIPKELQFLVGFVFVETPEMYRPVEEPKEKEKN